MAMSFSISALTANCGASVSEIELATLDDAEVVELRDALTRYGVLVFRDQAMTQDEHVALGRKFGELHHHPSASDSKLPAGMIRIHADGNSTFTAGFKWHSDVSCDPEPPMGSILALHTVPDGGGDTLFANMHAAYDALSDPIKQLLDGLTAVHSGAQVYTGRFGRQPEAGQQFPEAEHPVVRVHPETGRKALFVNENFTSHIVGLSTDESDAILSMLYEHIASPYFQCRFSWEPQSVAFWDNRSVQHLAVWDYFPQTRSGFRVTIAGDEPLSVT